MKYMNFPHIKNAYKIETIETIHGIITAYFSYLENELLIYLLIDKNIPIEVKEYNIDLNGNYEILSKISITNRVLNETQGIFIDPILIDNFLEWGIIVNNIKYNFIHGGIKNIRQNYLLNITGNDINILDDNNNIIEIHESNGIAKILYEKQNITKLETGIPIKENIPIDIEGLPDSYLEYPWIIVSREVKNAILIHKEYKYYSHFFIVPDELVQDENGNIMGYKCFSI